MSKWKKSAVMPSTEVTARSAQHEVVGAVVAHHADALHRQEHREGLPDGVVEAGLADLVEIDRVGLAQDVELFARDRAGAADREAGPGKRMPADEGFRQAELAAERPHLVLEEHAERLDEAHVHALRQPADIVVRLDGDRGPAGEGDALDHVGIERALREELGAAELLRLRLERLDEEPADDLPLRLRVGDAVKRGEERLARIDVDERDVVVAAEEAHDLLRLVLAASGRGRRRCR